MSGVLKETATLERDATSYNIETLYYWLMGLSF